MPAMNAGRASPITPMPIRNSAGMMSKGSVSMRSALPEMRCSAHCQSGTRRDRLYEHGCTANDAHMLRLRTLSIPLSLSIACAVPSLVGCTPIDDNEEEPEDEEEAGPD